MLLVTMAIACGKTVGETIDDATITTRVKTALINAPDVAALSIDVDTFKGVVTLSGRVKSQDEATRAMTVAQGIDGVREVKSALQVIPGN
ncbi:MAG: BON domain-containing protein [Acidobacteria bacterium]|nr:MAG: BON domain-containing protein [Acidobacteriota bacterium]